MPGTGVHDRSTSRLSLEKDKSCKDNSFQNLLDIEMERLN